MSRIEQQVEFQNLSHTPVELSVQLGVIRLSVKELLRLQQGDRLSIECGLEGIFPIRLEDVVVGDAILKVCDGNFFVEILSLAENVPSSGNSAEEMSINKTKKNS